MENLEIIRKDMSKALKSKRNERYYEKRKNDRMFCESCKRYIDKYCFAVHLKTRLHQRCQEITEEAKH